VRLAKPFVVLLGVTVALVLLGRVLVGIAGERQLLAGLTSEGVRGGCPSTDNCVSSLASQAPWQIDPIVCPGDPGAAQAVFVRVVLKLDRVEQIDDRTFVAYSRVLGFPDDIVIEPSARGLEVASSSRLGTSDLGVNRRRVEQLTIAVARDVACTVG
jgi:uncharacterized protein (DUF1499 family)